jgi:hypothetical protein
MIKKSLWMGLALSVLAGVSASAGQVGSVDRTTVLTFSQPVEVAGHVLPAGKYTFMLADSLGDRNIVKILDADGTHITYVMAIPNYRLVATDKTVIKFREVPSGSPEAIRAWFYPGDRFGQEFVYPKKRAALLARASNAPVPALAIDVDTADDMKTAPIIAVTPEEQEVPVTEAIQTTPVAATTGDAGRELPKTASPLPLIMLLGLGSIGVAFGLMAVGKFARTRG